MSKNVTREISARDLSEMLLLGKSSFLELKRKRIFLAGATGFFGKWLTQALIAANRYFDLDLNLVILTRSGENTMTSLPWLKNRNIQILEGDVRDFVFPEGNFDIIFNGAVEASAQLNQNHPEEMLDTCIRGAWRTWELARKSHAGTYMLASSGAVYGRLPENLRFVDETFLGGPDILNPGFSYHEGKRVSEMIGSVFSKQTGIDFKVARFFAFLGPYLPLDSHFAVGNFISDCLGERSVLVKGDGINYRSYLYGVDLVVWLLRVLTHGRSCHAYNVGSDVPVSIRELAQTVNGIGREFFDRSHLGTEEVVIVKKPEKNISPEYYVPAVNSIREELGVRVSVSLEEGIKRTFRWLTTDLN